jgi:hypothetical protein
MRRACPVGHPSGTGRHCPLCGRQYVTVSEPTSAPRHALVELIPAQRVECVPAPEQVDEPRPELEAWAMLHSLSLEETA